MSTPPTDPPDRGSPDGDSTLNDSGEVQGSIRPGSDPDDRVDGDSQPTGWWPFGARDHDDGREQDPEAETDAEADRPDSLEGHGGSDPGAQDGGETPDTADQPPPDLQEGEGIARWVDEQPMEGDDPAAAAAHGSPPQDHEGAGTQGSEDAAWSAPVADRAPGGEDRVSSPEDAVPATPEGARADESADARDADRDRANDSQAQAPDTFHVEHDGGPQVPGNGADDYERARVALEQEDAGALQTEEGGGAGFHVEHPADRSDTPSDEPSDAAAPDAAGDAATVDTADAGGPTRPTDAQIPDPGHPDAAADVTTAPDAAPTVHGPGPVPTHGAATLPPPPGTHADLDDLDDLDDRVDGDGEDVGDREAGYAERPGDEDDHGTAETLHVQHDVARGPSAAPQVDTVAPQPVPPPPPHRPRFDSAQILAVANQKGGVGKTTTAVSLAAAVAETGAQVLLVDLDPQGNASSGLGMRPREGQATIYHVLVEDLDILDAVQPANVRNLFVVPTNIDLAGAEVELVSMFSREQRLRRALESVVDEFDLIIIDCPPSLGLLTVNALTAAAGVIVPIQCEYYALEGLGALRRNADLVRANLNPGLEITGFVLTMLDARTRLSQQVVDEVKAHFGDRVFKTRIPRSVRLAEAPSFGQPITVFDPGSRGAMAYRRLAGELLERLGAR